MQFKHLSLLALMSYASAQTLTENNNTTPDLVGAIKSAGGKLDNLTDFITLVPGLFDKLNSAENITILAPTNDAFAKLVETLGPDGTKALQGNSDLVASILTYHVLNATVHAADITKTPVFAHTLLNAPAYSNVTGGQVVEAVAMDDKVVFYSGLLMNSTVVTADVNFTGGVIHLIDTVLTVPATVSATAGAAGLTSLTAALNATSLVSTIDDTPNLTIFAPTNDAFSAIGPAIKNLSTTDLAGILAYHVVNGTVGYSSGLTNGMTLPTVNGANLTITIDGSGDVFVNAAKVITPNVLVANGVVHVIDNVLSPNATSGPAASATSGTPAFTGGASPTSSGPAQATGAAAPMMTGAVGAAALFGAVGVAAFVGY